FGFQRIGDLAWAAGDIRARGFLMGATSGRTTLNGEGLQHQDGQSMMMASLIPSCISYDPSFIYEVVVIIQEGMRRMVENQEDIFYYISLLNENYIQPALPKGAEEGILKGGYLYQSGAKSEKRVQLMGSGSIFMEVLAAAELLKKDFQVEADVWSMPGVNMLHREAQRCESKNLKSNGKMELPYLTTQLEKHKGPVVAASDNVAAYFEQIRRLIPRDYTILGTDGWGRSDTRQALRRYFQVDRYHVVLAALQSLVKEGSLDSSEIKKAFQKYPLDKTYTTSVDL
ncbi:MAG: pyruvate dehydrogenase (acetyl-transferring), homodimeric type, partial [Spirochaetaceae bacterium]|nr:pyruvate dehydrogenase (acetyl-transferring), homodimeric type [Spirochaetaceae bacterium]